jgi:multiple sugar transport system substrate-binding protein
MSVGQMFETGKLAMTTCGRWCTTNYRNVLDFEFDVIPNPVGPSGELTTYQDQDDCTTTGWSGSVGVAIIAGSMGEEYAEQAYKFVEYIAGAEGQAEQAELGFQIPNQVELSKTDVFLQPDQDPAHSEVFIELARCALPGPWTRTPLYGQWFNDIFWGGVWPAVVVDNVELAEDAILDRADAFQEGLDEAWDSIE